MYSQQVSVDEWQLKNYETYGSCERVNICLNTVRSKTLTLYYTGRVEREKILQCFLNHKLIVLIRNKTYFNEPKRLLA